MSALRFNTKQLAAVALSAALWAILNITIVPVFWSATKLPILCDLIGVSLFVITAWWTNKPGTVAMMGAVATLLNFMLRPSAMQFLGFTVAAIAFDAALSVLGYKKARELSTMNSAILLTLSFASATIAGVLIGSFFMTSTALAGYGGLAFFAALHGAGGIAGGLLGVVLTKALGVRLSGRPPQ